MTPKNSQTRTQAKTFSDINLTNVFSGQSPKATEIKTKINQWDLIKLRSLCTAKETIKESNHWNGRKQFQTIQLTGAQSLKYKNNLYNLTAKKPITQWKNGQRPEQIFLQRRYTDGQQAHEKMLNITDYQRNANQNYYEVPPHTGQNSYH